MDTLLHFFLFLIKISFCFSSMNMTCGFPGILNKTSFDENTANYLMEQNEYNTTTIFPNEWIVTYNCLESDNEIFTENKVRQCLNGKWSGTIPRCGNNKSKQIL